MKVLVVGSLPPPAGSHRTALLTEVLRLRSEGHDVEIVALDSLSVAHRYLAAPGVPAAVEVGLLARHSDAVVVQLEPGLPVRHSAGRAERLVALMTLAAALRWRPNVTVRLRHPDDLPGGPGGRAAVELWKAAQHVEVGDEATRDELLAILGPLGDRVSVAPASELVRETSGTEDGLGLPLAVPSGWGEGADATAAQVQAVVRARAAAERELLATRGRLPIEGGGRAPRVPQWQWLPVPGAGVPDLGPIPVAARTLQSGRRRSRGRARTSPKSSSLRRAATSVLASAERRPATRPAAHLARLAFIELRGVARRAS